MLIYEEESHKIRGACFNVYNQLSEGIKEKIIERSLLQELKLSGLEVETQKRINTSTPLSINPEPFGTEPFGGELRAEPLTAEVHVERIDVMYRNQKGRIECFMSPLML